MDFKKQMFKITLNFTKILMSFILKSIFEIVRNTNEKETVHTVNISKTKRKR